MRVIPKHQALDAFHFKNQDDFVELLRFIKNDDGGKIDGRLRMDGHMAEALITAPNGVIKVNRYEWLIRTESGVYITMRDTEFESTYQRAAA